MSYKTDYDEDVKQYYTEGKSIRQIANELSLTKSKVETSLKRIKDLDINNADVVSVKDSIEIESESVLKTVKQLPSKRYNKIPKNTLQSFYATHLVNAWHEDKKANEELTDMLNKIAKIHNQGGIVSEELKNDMYLMLDILKTKKMLASKTSSMVNDAIKSIIKAKEASLHDINFDDITKPVVKEEDKKAKRRQKMVREFIEKTMQSVRDKYEEKQAEEDVSSDCNKQVT